MEFELFDPLFLTTIMVLALFFMENKTHPMDFYGKQLYGSKKESGI
jgi:hypothetical protein